MDITSWLIIIDVAFIVLFLYFFNEFYEAKKREKTLKWEIGHLEDRVRYLTSELKKLR